MPELLREAQPVARKDYRCSMCRGQIKAGERYERSTYKYEDSLYDFITCLGCVADNVVGEVYAEYDYDEGVTAAEAHEWAHETVKYAKTMDLREIAQRWLARNGCACEECDERVIRDADQKGGNRG